MSPVNSIQTRFAGCHFRSRLEARWAVAFDKLGFAWEYEPQGFTVGNRLNLEGLPDTWNYLPVFGDGYQLLCGRRSAAWPALVAAYTAARSARFEFGARGR